MRAHARHDRPRHPADAGHPERQRGHRRAGRRVGITAEPVRLNRYLAAAGLGTRRGVEGLIRHGRVTVDGVLADDPASRVAPAAEVALDGQVLYAPPGAAVLLHKPAGVPPSLAHPPGLAPALPLGVEEGGAELLLADRRLAERLADPRFPKPEQRDAQGRRTRVAGIDLGELGPGAWRPLSPAEVAKLRLGVRLPPR